MTTDLKPCPEREAFEAWYAPTFYGAPEWDGARNCYKNYGEHLAFLAWQAARAECDQLRQEVERLREGIRTVIEEGVQQVEGKVGKCPHGQFGYVGCEACTDEFLTELLSPRSVQGGEV